MARFASRHRLVVVGVLVSLIVLATDVPSQAQRTGASQTLTTVAASTTERIVFESNRDSNYEIYVMNADGTGETRLTNNSASDSDPTWSPDGTKIAFLSDRYRTLPGATEIYIMNADGSGQTRLTTDETPHLFLAWSPDGTRIAFTSSRAGNGDIYVINVNDKSETRLTEHTAFDREPTWSPDGTRIAFVSQRGFDGTSAIYVMNADGTAEVRLTAPNYSDREPAWSPDGHYIAFTSTRGANDDIYLMNADGTGPVNLTHSSSDDKAPTWSPDSRRIVFASALYGGGFYGPEEIVVINTSDLVQTPLTENTAEDLNPDWSPSVTIASAISGRVTDNNSNPMFGVPITATGPTAKSTTTSSSGYYVLSDLTPGSYTITPFLNGHVFSPPIQQVTIPPDTTSVNFIAIPASITVLPFDLPDGDYSTIAGDEILKISVSLNNKPTRAFIYRIDNNGEQALGYTDNSGILYSTFDSSWTPKVGNSFPTFRAVFENGTRINTTLSYSVSIVSKPSTAMLDRNSADAINRVLSSPEVMDAFSEVHISGCGSACSFVIEIISLVKDFAEWQHYHAEEGDVIKTATYAYESRQSSAPTFYRIVGQLERNGEIVSRESYWFDNAALLYFRRGGIITGILSPANLYLTDPQGRHTGVDPKTGKIVNEIPGSYYTGPNSEPELILVFSPINGTYSSAAVGTASGIVHFDTWSLTASGSALQQSIITSINSGQVIMQTVVYRDEYIVYLPLLRRT